MKAKEFRERFAGLEGRAAYEVISLADEKLINEKEHIFIECAVSYKSLYKQYEDFTKGEKVKMGRFFEGANLVCAGDFKMSFTTDSVVRDVRRYFLVLENLILATDKDKLREDVIITNSIFKNNSSMVIPLAPMTLDFTPAQLH